MNKKDLVAYINEYLDINSFVDSSLNGLQVDNSKNEIKKIGYAVDANTYLIDKAIKENVDMLIVHHGIFWDKDKRGIGQRLVEVQYERVKKLINNDISLYASHLPLDAHNVVGNNIGLLNNFISIFSLREGTYEIEKFGIYDGQTIGFAIRFEKSIGIQEFVDKYTSSLGLEKKFYNFGNVKTISSIAFISGGALSYVNQAKEANYDLFVTGEGSHSDIALSKEIKQSILLGGHYETEKIGPSLLANHLKQMFSIDIVYIDEKY